MKRNYSLLLLLCCFLLAHQTAKADNQVVFNETFDKCNGIGANDGVWDGSSVNGGPAVKNGDLIPDNEGWTFTNCGGTYQCLKFGTGKANGVVVTPHISLKVGTTATLTFRVAGWKETKESSNNTLEVSGTNCKVSGDINFTMPKADWKECTVTITDITDAVTITFTGKKRGFLDNVKIVGEKGGEITVTVPDPTLTEEFTFWSNTTEPTKRLITITPAENTRVRYTLDGSEPSLTEGKEITAATSLFIWETTTVKAISTKSLYTSDVVTKTYTLGQPVNGLADFCALAEDTEAKLFLSAEQNARVTAVDGKTFTVKDGTTTLLFDFGNVAFNPAPAVNQHIAGWIIGKKQTVGETIKFAATAHTTPAYMAFANRVTEADVTSVRTVTTKQDGTETYYNLSGLKVKNPTKGVYVANGKKLIIH